MPAVETGISKNQIIAELAKSPHGDLKDYVPLARRAAVEEPDFLAHLISWNRDKGQVRDSKVALPIITLATPAFSDPDYLENSLAHLGTLAPKYLMRAWRFEKQVRMTTKRRKMFWAMIERYLRFREGNRRLWDQTAIQHRGPLQELYRTCHVKPAEWADRILFKNQYPKGSVFADVAALSNMGATEAAATIMKWKLPWLLVPMLLGKKLKEPDILMVMIERMSATDLVNQSKFLDKLGMQKIPAAKAAYEQALAKASANPKANALRAAKAIEMVEDEGLKEKLRVVQEKQMKASGIEGDWLVLGDCSGSMSQAIEVSRHVSATLAKMVKGQVHLIFFNTSPTHFEVTDKSYDEILKATKRIVANGGTSIGCGLQYVLDEKIDVGGIAIISDGGENTTPYFGKVYQRYVKELDRTPTVYLYLTDGESDVFSSRCAQDDIDVQKFDLRRKTLDLYSLPNLVGTMRTSRYSLVNEIMDTPFLTQDMVFAAS